MEDDYATMTEDYNIVDQSTDTKTFFSWNEMSDLNIKKEDISWNDISGDPKNMNQIRKSQKIQMDDTSQFKPRKSNQQICGDQGCSLRPVAEKVVDYTVCPICSQKWVATCSCEKHDSVCPNKHKWHVDNGRIKLGHTH